MKLLKQKSLLIALALAASASLAHSQAIWNGSESGDWQVGDNWDAGTAPTSGDVHFGLADRYTITNRPTSDLGTITFQSAATQSYSISGGGFGSQAHVTVEASAHGVANHTLARLRTDNRTVDVQSLTTSLTVQQWDGGAAGTVLTKEGSGTLIWSGGFVNNVRTVQLDAGTIDHRQGMGTNGTFVLSGANSNAEFTRSTSGFSTMNMAMEAAPATPIAASFAGQVTGNLNLVMGRSTVNNSGAIQTFTGTNTYVGTTTINSGTVIVNETHTGGGNYVINSRNTATALGGNGFVHGTLGGSGSIVLAAAGDTFSFTGADADKNAILYPGASDTDTETLTLGSALIATTVNLNEYSVLRIDLGANGQSDRVDIFGQLNIAAANTTLDLRELAGAWDGTPYTIATFTSWNGNQFAEVEGLESGWNVVYGPNSITVIPEPNAVLLLIGGLGMLTLLRRRSRRLS